MPYTPDPTQVTEPTDLQKASSMALEFRTLKNYIQATLLPLIAGKIGTGGGTSTGPITVRADVGFVNFPLADTTTSSANFTLANAAYNNFFQLISLSPTYVGNLYGAVANESLIHSSSTLVFSLGGSKKGWLDNAGFHFNQVVEANISGNAVTSTVAAYANVAPWGGITGKPTALSQFTNDIGFLTTIAWTSVTGRPTALSQFTNDLAGSGISSFNGRTANAAVLLNSDISGALGFTPYSAGNPANFQGPGGSVAYAGVAGSITWSGISSIPTNSNAYGNKTVSTSGPSGGSDGDIWYQVP